jgi:hypothetical protein
MTQSEKSHPNEVSQSEKDYELRTGAWCDISNDINNANIMMMLMLISY